jgi:hypothetical protein
MYVVEFRHRKHNGIIDFQLDFFLFLLNMFTW